MLDQFAVVMLPGIYGSDADHWQTTWERDNPTFRRFQPSSWDHPELDDWARALSAATVASRRPVVLVAHSLATLLVAHWARIDDAPADRVAGAFLVSVPDPDGANFPDEAPTFRFPPRHPLPFPARMVVSSTDPYSSLGYARAAASAWGADLVEVGALGHITSGTVPSHWPDGWRLLHDFADGLAIPTGSPRPAP